VTQGLKQAVMDLLGSGQKDIEVMARLVYEHIVGEAIGGSEERENHFQCKTLKYFFEIYKEVTDIEKARQKIEKSI
jgi:hypothetical protein